MDTITPQVQEFRDKLAELPRERLIEIIREQNPQYVDEINRIEWVFRNKLTDLLNPDGTPITERDFTHEELIRVIDPPFIYSTELMRQGFNEEMQRQIHIAADPVLWCKQILGITPRIYQVLVMRDTHHQIVMRLGRRSGKSFCLAAYMLWHAFVHTRDRILVLAPVKNQVALLYEAILELAENSPIVRDAITKKPRNPQYEIWFSNGSSIKLFTTGLKNASKCLTPNHDVLTKENGWVPIANVKAGDIVASWNEGKLIWKEAAAVWSYDYDGPMLNYDSRNLRFTATPEHRWKVISRAGGSRRTMKSTYWLDSTELRANTLIPAVGDPMPTETENYSGAEMELWGWWLAEGSGFDYNMARISQVKEEGRARIIEVAKELGVHYSVFKREIRVRWKPPIFSGTVSYDKFIPRELMLEKHRDRLLKGLLLGDGCKTDIGWLYSSSSEKLAEGVQELAFLEGNRVYMTERKMDYYEPVGGGPCKRHWAVSIKPVIAWTYNTANENWIDYKGKVHCLTVPGTGTFVARRDGKAAFITGNSDGARGQEADMIVLDEMDYMGTDDLVAVMAMLMKTDPTKLFQKKLIGASTPTGQRKTFWSWNVNPQEDFHAYFFPSLCNMLWNSEEERKARLRYRNEQQYRHEILADWGEDADGVYPRKYVDRAFNVEKEWEYKISAYDNNQYVYTLGVDWDKHGAGVNVVAAQTPRANPAAGPIKVVYREEIQKGDFTYTESVKRILELDSIFKFDHIYVDQGAGEYQVEVLHQYGIDNPHTKIHLKTKAYHFSNTIEIRDPYTRQIEKKRIKPFIVDNLVHYLEIERIIFNASDDELYLQLISYIKLRENDSGYPVFAPGGDTQDHAHDALLLALFAITENYDALFEQSYNFAPVAISNSFFIPDSNKEKEPKGPDIIKDKNTGEIRLQAPLKASVGSRSGRKSTNRMIKRKSF